jgi:hypothetical protein
MKFERTVGRKKSVVFQKESLNTFTSSSKGEIRERESTGEAGLVHYVFGSKRKLVTCATPWAVSDLFDSIPGTRMTHRNRYSAVVI